MDIKSMYARARRGIRDDVKLYLVAISSLTVAFLCLATALLGVANLSALSARWGQSQRMSIYLRAGASEAELAQIQSSLGEMASVQRTEYVSSERAREQFLQGTVAVHALRELPKSAFPASLEVTFVPATTAGTIDEVAQKLVLQQSVVEDVDTYRSWFQPIGELVSTMRAVALGLGMLVLLCVVAVVANTIRLAIASRREEIEVLKMCGATDAFVRAPFVLEGTLQGLVAALLSVLLLVSIFLAIRAQIDPALTSFAGIRFVFLSPTMVVGLLATGAAVGALGSALSVRRYIAV